MRQSFDDFGRDGRHAGSGAGFRLHADEPLPVCGGLCYDQWRPARCGVSGRQWAEHRHQRISGHSRCRFARFAGQRHVRSVGPGARVQNPFRQFAKHQLRLDLRRDAGPRLSGPICQSDWRHLEQSAGRLELRRAAGGDIEFHRRAAGGNASSASTACSCCRSLRAKRNFHRVALGYRCCREADFENVAVRCAGRVAQRHRGGITLEPSD